MRRPRDDKGTHRHTEYAVCRRTEAEWTGASLSPGRHQKLGRRKEGFSPTGPFRGDMALQHLDFGHLVSRTVRECICVVLHHPVCGNLLLCRLRKPTAYEGCP